MSLEKDLREAIGCLAASIKSIRDDDEIDADERSELIAESQDQFKKYLNNLVLTDIQKRAALVEAKVTKESDTMSEVHQFKKLEINAPVNQEAAAELIKLARSVNAGTTGNHASKASWYDVLKRLSEQDRQEGESREQALARYIQAGDGAEVFKAYRSASGPDFQTVPVAAPVIRAGSAYEKLCKIADEMCAADPSMKSAHRRCQDRQRPEATRTLERGQGIRVNANSLGPLFSRAQTAGPRRRWLRVRLFGIRMPVGIAGLLFGGLAREVGESRK